MTLIQGELLLSYKNNNTIPIVMGTDENYVMLTSVAMWSILASSSPSTQYKFYIMLHGDVYDTALAVFSQVINKYSNAQIEYLNMKSLFEEFDRLEEGHITFAAYYRMMIPDLLKGHSKCLYLDGDIIACCDLYELYKIELGNDYIAGVKQIINQTLPPPQQRNIAREQGFQLLTFTLIQACC